MYRTAGGKSDQSGKLSRIRKTCYRSGRINLIGQTEIHQAEPNSAIDFSTIYARISHSVSECEEKEGFRMRRQVLSLLVENTAGVTSHISGLFSRRGDNIDSCSSGVTADPKYTRITIVASGDAPALGRSTHDCAGARLQVATMLLSTRLLPEDEFQFIFYVDARIRSTSFRVMTLSSYMAGW